MHVLIYAHYQPPAPSASATRMMSLAKHLAARGHQVTFLTSQPGPTEAQGFPVIRAKGRLGLIKALRKGPRQVIFVSSPPATPAAEVAMAARVLGYKVMVDIRDPYVLEALKNSEVKPGLKTHIKSVLEWTLPRYSHRISFVSEYLRDEFAAFCGHELPHAVIAPNGADLDIFKYTPQARQAARQALGVGNETVFVYSGILGGKDLDKTIDALAPALRQGAKFLIVGIVDQYSRPLKDALIAQMAALGLSEQLLWRENLSVNELAALLPGADIGVNPLPSHRAYCLPVKTYEYMATGLFNLAHGGNGSALLSTLSEKAGAGCVDWASFSSQALALCERIEAVRADAALRATLALSYGRASSNEKLGRELELLGATHGCAGCSC